MASDKFIKEIADKLQNHTSEVSPQMWQAVSAQIGTGASALGFGKVAAIVIGTTAIAVASYFAISSSEEPTKKEAKVEQTQPSEKVAANEATRTLVESNVENAETTNKSATKSNETIVETNESATLEIQDEPNETVVDFTSIEIPMVVEDVRSIPKDVNTTEAKKPVSETTQTKPEVNIQSNAGSQPDATNKSFGITKLPNTFTPNNDGVNDYFSVESKGLSGYLLVVLDKDNNKIWQTIDTKAKWDGRDQSGQMAPTGSYIYFVSATGPNGEKIGKYQRLTITK